MATLDEKLKSRYGQERFNPAAGQNAMSYREWLDRHPSMKNVPESEWKGRYKDAVSSDQGVDWTGLQVDAPVAFRDGDAPLNNVGKELTPGSVWKPAPDPNRANERPDPPPTKAPAKKTDHPKGDKRSRVAHELTRPRRLRTLAAAKRARAGSR